MFFGDYEGQFEPFRDRWNTDQRNGDNDLMYQLCNNFRVQLQTYRRGCDAQLFAWFCSLYGNRTLLHWPTTAAHAIPQRATPMQTRWCCVCRTPNACESTRAKTSC